MKKILLSCLFFLPMLANAQWITRDTMPFAVQEAPAVAVNNIIYYAGGISAAPAIVQTVEVYNPATDTWSNGVDLPAPRHHHAMCSLNGKIYVMGGYHDLQFNVTNDVFMYDPDSLMWFTKAPLPYYLAAADAAAYNGKIYCIGGTNGNNALNYCLEYDPIADTWTQKNNMPTAREHLCVATADSLIYAIAGRGTFGSETVVESYNPANDTWTTAPNLPTGRGGCDATVVNGKIYVLGGEVSVYVFDENQMFDPASQTWTNLDTMPHARHGLGVVAVGDTVYAIGGATVAGYGACNLNEAYVTSSISAVHQSPINDKQISITPNPVHDELNIKGCELCIGKNLVVYDTYGNALMQKPITTSLFKLPTSTLKQGIYFLKIGNVVNSFVKL